MNPALSVIFFTTVSGAGYGMLTWLGILAAAGALPATPWFGVSAVAIGLGLATAGLLASTLHLGRADRAWRAVSQWRTSWLSREGLAALAAYPPAFGFAVAWAVAGRPGPAAVALGLIAAALAVATVVCTAMIYASLKPVRQWNNRYVPPGYLLNSLFSGGVCLGAVTGFWLPPAGRIAGGIALACGIAALAVKLAYWRHIDTAPARSTSGTATGLGKLGPVRLLDSPNTEENYLLREMGYRIARKHARGLRRITLALGYGLPLLLLIAAVAAGGVPAMALLPAAAICVLPGLLVDRWLFFAEATHTVTLYYGRTAA
jgi:sulfite dehydrogenase (quinone) subunit SoeC